MPTNRMLEGKPFLKEDITDLCYERAPVFVKKLLSIMGISFPVNPNEDFVIYGFQIPTEDQKNKLWVKTDRNGHFQGYFLFIEGKWQRVYDHSINDVVWKTGDSRFLEAGFRLIDGTIPSLSVPLQDYLKTFYRLSPDSTDPLFPYYEYFATIYEGI